MALIATVFPPVNQVFYHMECDDVNSWITANLLTCDYEATDLWVHFTVVNQHDQSSYLNRFL